MKKRLLTIFLALSLAVGLCIPAGAASDGHFSDVSDRDTALAIETLRLMGALDGFEDGTFRPEGNLTRAQFCKIAIYAMNGQSELGMYSTITVFPDVKGSHWASAYVNMAAKGEKLIAGFPDGSFHPEEAITAGQAVTILLRMLGYADKDVGGVWPESYMALGKKIELLKGLDVDGRSALRRDQAARLFLNLMQCNTAGGGAYLTTLGLTGSEGVLVDSSGGCMELDSGAVYPMAYADSTGALNGHRGTLLLNAQGKAVTFVPTDIGEGITITLASASATRITDSKGGRYTVTRDATGYYAGEQQAWSAIYAWLNPGTEVTLYLSPAGQVEYVFASSLASENAVIVAKDGSAAGFDALAGGRSYTIYKNGVKATLSDLKKDDVATFSPTTNTIRVCDTRVNVYYEDCTPSPKEPLTITVLGGLQLNVLNSGLESVAKFKPGSQMTLLLTEDGQVAGATNLTSKANAIGLVVDGKVQMFCGNGRITVGAAPEAGEFEGMVVNVSSRKEGVKLTKAEGKKASTLYVTEGKLGTKPLAENVMIFDGTDSVALSELLTAEIPASEIAYVRENWKDEIDFIQLGDPKGGVVIYGRAAVTTSEEGGIFGSVEVTDLTVTNGSSSEGPHRTAYRVSNGDFVAATLRGDKFVRVEKLDAVRSVPNTAWDSPTSVTYKGILYTVDQDAACYNRTSKRWMTLSQGHAYAEECTLYVQGDVVRVIEIQ